MFVTLEWQFSTYKGKKILTSTFYWKFHDYEEACGMQLHSGPSGETLS